MKQQELFIPYELALICKEKGFDEECFGYWNGKEIYRLGGDSTLSINEITTYRNTFLSFKDENIVIPNEKDWKDNPNTIRKTWGTQVAAPLYQQVCDWLREKHGIDIYVKKDRDRGVCLGYESIIETEEGNIDCNTHETYYESLNAAITEALKLI